VSGKMIEYKSSPMIKETEPLPHMLPSHKHKDLLVMPLKIKLPKTHITPFSMLKDLSEENLMIQLFNQI
jgi:hypothetical protein